MAAAVIAHPFVSSIADGGDTTLVQPSNWNASHSITGEIQAANGGTGLSASGATGNVLTSNGTAWVSQAPAAVRVVSIAGTAGGSIAPTAGTADQYNITALGASANFIAPTGTPADGQKLMIRIKDDNTARALTWTLTSGAYRAIGLTLPTTTVATLVTYVGCIYNSQAVFWDVVAVSQQ